MTPRTSMGCAPSSACSAADGTAPRHEPPRRDAHLRRRLHRDVPHALVARRRPAGGARRLDRGVAPCDRAALRDGGRPGGGARAARRARRRVGRRSSSSCSLLQTNPAALPASATWRRWRRGRARSSWRSMKCAPRPRASAPSLRAKRHRRRVVALVEKATASLPTKRPPRRRRRRRRAARRCVRQPARRPAQLGGAGRSMRRSAATTPRSPRARRVDEAVRRRRRPLRRRAAADDEGPLRHLIVVGAAAPRGGGARSRRTPARPPQRAHMTARAASPPFRRMAPARQRRARTCGGRRSGVRY